METLILKQETEPLPIKNETVIIETYEGFLNSSYKKVAKQNFFNSNPRSVFGIKQRLKSKQYNFSCNAETILKLSVFALVLAIAIA